MLTVTFDTDSEVAELEQNLFELQHHLLELKAISFGVDEAGYTESSARQ